MDIRIADASCQMANAVLYGKIAWSSEEWWSMIVIVEFECDRFCPGSRKRTRLVLHVMKTLDCLDLGAMCTYNNVQR